MSTAMTAAGHTAVSLSVAASVGSIRLRVSQLAMQVNFIGRGYSHHRRCRRRSSSSRRQQQRQLLWKPKQDAREQGGGDSPEDYRLNRTIEKGVTNWATAFSFVGSTSRFDCQSS